MRKATGAALSVVLLIAAILGVSAGMRETENSAYPRKYMSIIEQYSAEYGVDEMLLYAVARCESGFVPDAVSSVGARGLMQLTEDTFNWVAWRLNEERGYDEAFDPEVSVRYGAYLLSYLLGRFDSEETALAAYHAGVGVVGRWLSDEAYSSDGKTLHTIPYKDTAGYVPKVQKTKARYEKLYG